MPDRKPYITINLRVTPTEHAALVEMKGKQKWEDYFLGLTGLWESRNV